MRETGLIHLYCGDGKGKTTAAMGLALRSIGRGKKVVIAQFLKDGTSGECQFLSRQAGVTLLAANPVGKFSFAMTEEEKQQTKEAIVRMFEAATQYAVRENAFLLVMDEVCAAITCGFLEEEQVISFLQQKPDTLEVALTGRDPSERLQAQADYISEVCKRKHPFDCGIMAREGIEQ
ncbi:MAG: cob(I)yrinic acid a,c-diamide adenosyltransferase [Butyricicoccus pullicaecorum]|nr:cob(I)yrinic acid a,c-diamide adenosyltransferase [Butyricicoccus pullicaecorum]